MKKQKKSKNVYEAPLAIDLSQTAVNGQQLDTRGTCYTGTGPGYCNTGNSPVDQCSVGNGALASQNCRQGHYAAFSCRGGHGVYTQSCAAGDRPYHCTVGSRA